MGQAYVSDLKTLEYCNLIRDFVTDVSKQSKFIIHIQHRLEKQHEQEDTNVFSI